MSSSTSSVLAGAAVQSLSVGGDGSVFAVDGQGSILQNTKGVRAWTSLPQAAAYVAVSSTAKIACVVNKGQAAVMDLGSGAWTQLGPTSTDLATVSIGFDKNSEKTVVWAVDASRQLWRCVLPFERWEPASTTITADAITATPDGAVFLLSAGDLSSMTGATWVTIPTPEKVTSVAAGLTGWLWIVGQSGKIYHDRGGEWIEVHSPRSAGVGQISCGQDLTVWLALAGTLYAFNSVSQRFVEIEGPASGVTQASVSTREQAFAINAAHNLFRYTMDLSTWQPLGVAGLPPIKQVATADRTRVYALDDGSRVWAAAVTDGAWAATQLPGKFASIAAAEDGTIWGLDAEGAASELVDGAWQLRSAQPKLVNIHVAAADQVVALDHHGAAWQWSPHDVRWTQFEPQAPEPLASISIAPGRTFWVVATSGRLLAWLGAWFTTGADHLQAVSAGPGGEVWGIDAGGAADEIVPPNAGVLSDGSLNRPRALPRLIQPLWDAEDVFNEAASTHLWIVNNAARLARGQGPVGQQIYNLIAPDKKGQQPDNPFHNRMCQGLYDADRDDAGRLVLPKGARRLPQGQFGRRRLYVRALAALFDRPDAADAFSELHGA